MECNSRVQSIRLRSDVSVIILLIKELGNSGQLDVWRALINGTCTRRQRKTLVWIPAVQNKVNLVPLHSTWTCSYQETKGAYYAAQCAAAAAAPAGELRSQNGGDDRKSDILPWQLPWLCVGIMALRRGNSCRVRLQQPLLSALLSAPLCSNHKQLTPDLPAALMSFSHI